MGTVSHGRHRPRTARSVLLLATAAAAATVLVACSSTTSTPQSSTPTASSSSTSSAAASVDPAALAATIKKFFLTDIDPTTLDPVVLRTMDIASRPWTDANQATLMNCLKNDVCQTGTGGLTIGFPNDNINPWRQMFRAEMDAQAIQSGQVSKIIYSLSPDVAGWLANVKSMIAQKPDVMVIDSIYGPAILPVVQQAKAAGIVVVEAETPLPPSVSGVVDAQATSDLCAFYNDAAGRAAKLVPSSGTYGLYTGVPGNGSAAVWQPCLTKSIESAGFKQVIQGFTQWTPQGMTQQGTALYASGKNPSVVAYDYTMEYFAAPFLKDGKTPPIMVSDVINTAYLQQSKAASDKGVKVQGFVANGRSWYGRIGLTAGLMIKSGEKVNQQITIPYPASSLDQILPSFDATMPANAPVPVGFDAAQTAAILSAG